MYPSNPINEPIPVLQTIIHYSLHLIAPLAIAYIFYRDNWKMSYLILLATMLVDLDHLLATPIFDPTRCSLGFHPLHTGYAIIVYIALLFFKHPYRLIGIGLLFHMLTDIIDAFLSGHHVSFMTFW